MGRPFNKPNTLPEVEKLRAMFHYNAESGLLVWAKRPEGAHRANWWNSVIAGKPAGARYGSSRYLRLTLDDTHYLAHRVIWKIETGEDAEFIDHINGDGTDNRFCNLRDVSRTDNLKNKALYKNSSSGYHGVGYHKRDKVWTAKIGVGGKQVQLGSFKTKDEAIASMRAASIVLDYHPNHGR